MSAYVGPPPKSPFDLKKPSVRGRLMGSTAIRLVPIKETKKDENNGG